MLFLSDQIEVPVVLVLQEVEELDAPESCVKLTKYEKNTAGVLDGVILGVTGGVLLTLIDGVGVAVDVGVTVGGGVVDGVDEGSIQISDVATTPNVVIWNTLAGLTNPEVAKPYHSRLPFHTADRLGLE